MLHQNSIVANLEREKGASVREMSPEALRDLASQSGASVETTPCQTMKTRSNRGGKRPDGNKERMISPAHTERKLAFFHCPANELRFEPRAVAESHLNMHLAKEADRLAHRGAQKLEVILTWMGEHHVAFQAVADCRFSWFTDQEFMNPHLWSAATRAFGERIVDYLRGHMRTLLHQYGAFDITTIANGTRLLCIMGGGTNATTLQTETFCLSMMPVNTVRFGAIDLGEQIDAVFRDFGMQPESLGADTDSVNMLVGKLCTSGIYPTLIKAKLTPDLGHMMDLVQQEGYKAMGWV
jgi:hypothetical protein